MMKLILELIFLGIFVWIGYRTEKSLRDRDKKIDQILKALSH
ncbi:MAG: hypothetical protein QME81_08080 [bacterium]|nr:hypothetical protein [bacterium]